MPSVEYLALQSLRHPPRSQAGDMWLCRRLGIVRVFNAHKRGSRRGAVNNSFHLFHWGKPAMWSSPAEWRDDDMNAHIYDPALKHVAGESWEYLGNIFDLLSFAALAQTKTTEG